MPRLNRSQEPLPIAEFAARLSPDPMDSIFRWPYPDHPLTHDEDTITSVAGLKGGQAIVRGLIVKPYPGVANSELTVSVGDIASSNSLYLHYPVQAPLWQLVGLTIEAACTLEPPESIHTRSFMGTIESVQGIQTPLQPGDASGVARGRVDHVVGPDHGDESWGIDLDIGTDVLAVHWNPSISDRLRECGIVEPGAFVSMPLIQMGSSPFEYMYNAGFASRLISV